MLVDRRVWPGGKAHKGNKQRTPWKGLAISLMRFVETAWQLVGKRKDGRHCETARSPLDNFKGLNLAVFSGSGGLSPSVLKSRWVRPANGDLMGLESCRVERLRVEKVIVLTGLTGELLGGS